jgi:hypothetical protein
MTESRDTKRPDRTSVSDETRAADRRDARATGHADRMPTPDEEAAAPTSVDPSVAEDYEAALERGANTKGEGRIDP